MTFFRFFLQLLVVMMLSRAADGSAEVDWLVSAPATSSYVISAPDFVEIGNGLVSRRFMLLNKTSGSGTVTGFATTELMLNATISRGGEQSAFRRVTPESVISLDGKLYTVGGARQQSTNLAYCNRTDLPQNIEVDTTAFTYKLHSVSEPQAPVSRK